MAWLNATPKDEKKSRREQLSEGGESSPLLFLPPIDGAEYLIELWHECGTVESHSGGITPLSWKELNQFVENQYTTTEQAWVDIGDDAQQLKEQRICLIEPWEIALIKTLSDEYSSEYHQASDRDRPAPYKEIEVSEEEYNRKIVQSKVSGFFSALKKGKNEPKYTVE